MKCASWARNRSQLKSRIWWPFLILAPLPRVHALPQVGAGLRAVPYHGTTLIARIDAHELDHCLAFQFSRAIRSDQPPLSMGGIASARARAWSPLCFSSRT